MRVDHALPASLLVGANGEQFVKIGEEISEQLDIVPAAIPTVDIDNWLPPLAAHGNLKETFHIGEQHKVE